MAFEAHVELLQTYIAQRAALVERIQELLNAQRESVAYFQDATLQSRRFQDCFFSLPGITPELARLRGQLEIAHWADGFKPRAVPGNDLVDPAQMMVRAFYFWQQTRWPGRNGRLRYAETLLNLYLIRNLELLTLRVFDAGGGVAGERLTRIQGLLDELWKSSPADQPVLVRDARWLVPLAQSPTTDDLAPYFDVAGHVAASLSEVDRVEIHKASVVMAGGHLRSQLRHYCLKRGVSLAENGLVLSSRNSNALDFAMTVQSLVTLLNAYEHAIDGGDARARLEWAGAICQGLSADPALFVNHTDLLGAYSMIEYLFITTASDGRAVYTPIGDRHVGLLEEYAARIRRLSKSLYEDLHHFKPVAGRYSPYGLIYGFSSNLTEHIALKSLQSKTVTPFSLEDVFNERDSSADKLAWVSGWRRLPHIKQDVQRLFDYPQQFAEAIFGRIEDALAAAAAHGVANRGVRTGRLFITAADAESNDLLRSGVPDLPVRYIVSSDPQLAGAGVAHFIDEATLLHDRNEGMYLVSYHTPGGWVAITKDILTDILAAGEDLRISRLPTQAAGVLALMCPNLDQPSTPSRQ